MIVVEICEGGQSKMTASYMSPLTLVVVPHMDALWVRWKERDHSENFPLGKTVDTRC